MLVVLCARKELEQSSTAAGTSANKHAAAATVPCLVQHSSHATPCRHYSPQRSLLTTVVVRCITFPTQQCVGTP
jgi:hypothetical protein